MATPSAQEGGFFQVWSHDWQAVLLRPEPDIELPGTWFGARPADLEETRRPLLLHYDDRQRHKPLYHGGILTQAIGFLDRDRPETHVSYLGVDLRGWGDSAPGMYPYEIASWGATDRTLAYMTAALGDPLMSMRIRDGLAALAYARSRAEVDADRIIVSGRGLGGVVALHVAAIDGDVRGVLLWESLVSFISLLRVSDYTWPAEAFIPGVLQSYDLPELVGALSCAVRVLKPLDGRGEPLPHAELEGLNADLGREVYAPDASAQALTQALREMLEIEAE